VVGPHLLKWIDLVKRVCVCILGVFCNRIKNGLLRVGECMSNFSDLVRVSKFYLLPMHSKLVIFYHTASSV
jgi:hypothetical protein